MIAVVDYGMGNLRSVEKGLEAAGSTVSVTGSAADLRKASGIVLPGVGAFGDAINNLERRGLADVIVDEIGKGKPFLGICLGLQLLFEGSDEGRPGARRQRGLGVLEGEVVHLPRDVKVPHIGWNRIRKRLDTPFLEGVDDGAFFYFVHSYHGQPHDANVVATMTDYGVDFVSSVWRDNIFAVQFHPEKSSGPGLKIMENFGRISRES